MTTFIESFDTADSPVLGPDLTWSKFSAAQPGFSEGGGPDDGEVFSNSFGVRGGLRCVFSDSFNRADSSSSLGSTDSAYGGTTASWVVQSGTFGISSNRAYESTGTSQRTAVIETSIADCIVEVTLTHPADSGLCWRASDDNNYWLTNSAGDIYKRVAGGFTNVGSLSGGSLSDGDVLRVVLSGNTHTLYVNGVQEATFSDAHNASATKHGLRVSDQVAARFDDFKIYDETTLAVEAQEATCWARAEHDTGSTSVYAQAEIAALELTDNYPIFYVGASLDNFAGPLDGSTNDYYQGPTGVWAQIEPAYNFPDGCGIEVYLYDAPSHDDFYIPWETAPGGSGGAYYALGPVLAPGDVIRIDHNAAARYIEVMINGTVYWAGSYEVVDNPIAAFGERGGLGVVAFAEPNPYPGDIDRLDNFETGISTLVAPEPPVLPTNQLIATHFADGEYPDGDSTVLAPLSITFKDPLLDLGTATVVLRANDPMVPEIAPEDYIAISIVGSDPDVIAEVGVLIVDDDDLLAIDQGEEAEQKGTYTGPLVLGLFGDGEIEPPNGTNSRPVVDDVHYDWTHPAYDASAAPWTNATEITSLWYAQRDASGDFVEDNVDHAGGRWGYLQWWTKNMPPGNETAPDIRESTKIIGPSSGTIDGVGVPAGDCFLNEKFTTWFEGDHAVWLLADNSAVLYIDGAEIASVGFSGDTRLSGYESGGQATMVSLTAGEHTVAIKMTNGAIPFVGVPNPFGVAASIYVPTYPVLPDDLIWETTGSMRILEYPAETPGMTPCQVARIFLESHQANDRFLGWSLGCDDDQDSADEDWNVRPVISMRVGSDDGLSLFLKIMEAYSDVRIPAPGRVVEMYNKDAFAPPSGVDFEVGNLTLLRFRRQRMLADELLIRSQFGWTRAGEPGGRRQGSFTFGPENAFDEITRLALKALAFSSEPLDMTELAYKPRDDSEIPYLPRAGDEQFVPGALAASVPTRGGGTSDDRVVQIGGLWAEGEELVITVVVKDLRLQEQERILRALKALGA